MTQWLVFPSSYHFISQYSSFIQIIVYPSHYWLVSGSGNWAQPESAQQLNGCYAQCNLEGRDSINYMEIGRAKCFKKTKTLFDFKFYFRIRIWDILVTDVRIRARAAGVVLASGCLMQFMTAWQNARIVKSSVGTAFYPCCTLAERLVGKV